MPFFCSITKYSNKAIKKIDIYVKYFYWPFQGGTSFVDHLRYLRSVFIS